jgi:hypothetical protein
VSTLTTTTTLTPHDTIAVTALLSGPDLDTESISELYVRLAVAKALNSVPVKGKGKSFHAALIVLTDAPELVRTRLSRRDGGASWRIKLQVRVPVGKQDLLMCVLTESLANGNMDKVLAGRAFPLGFRTATMLVEETSNTVSAEECKALLVYTEGDEPVPGGSLGATDSGDDDTRLTPAIITLIVVAAVLVLACVLFCCCRMALCECCTGPKPSKVQANYTATSTEGVWDPPAKRRAKSPPHAWDATQQHQQPYFNVAAADGGGGDRPHQRSRPAQVRFAPRDQLDESESWHWDAAQQALSLQGRVPRSPPPRRGGGGEYSAAVADPYGEDGGYGEINLGHDSYDDHYLDIAPTRSADGPWTSEYDDTLEFMDALSSQKDKGFGAGGRRPHPAGTPQGWRPTPPSGHPSQSWEELGWDSQPWAEGVRMEDHYGGSAPIPIGSTIRGTRAAVAAGTPQQLRLSRASTVNGNVYSNIATV